MFDWLEADDTGIVVVELVASVVVFLASLTRPRASGPVAPEPITLLVSCFLRVFDIRRSRTSNGRWCPDRLFLGNGWADFPEIFWERPIGSGGSGRGVKVGWSGLGLLLFFKNRYFQG